MKTVLLMLLASLTLTRAWPETGHNERAADNWSSLANQPSPPPSRDGWATSEVVPRAPCFNCPPVEALPSPPASPSFAVAQVVGAQHVFSWTNATNANDQHRGRQLGTTCNRPWYWCTHGGSTYSVTDCDGDGVPDHHCESMATTNERGFLSSASGCRDTWGVPSSSNLCQSCPNFLKASGGPDWAGVCM